MKILEALPRLGLGIVYLLWGIDKFLAIDRYVSWMEITWRVSWISSFIDLRLFTILLGIFEVGLAMLLLTGLLHKLSMALVALSSTLFLFFAGPPMSYPQDIALLAIAIYLFNRGPDPFSLDYRLRKTLV